LSLGPSMANVEHRIAQHASALAAAGACGVRWTVADFSAARDDFAIPITPYLV
jgi:putative N-acetylmannosamine-6-phosphate epimerase